MIRDYTSGSVGRSKKLKRFLLLPISAVVLLVLGSAGFTAVYFIVNRPQTNLKIDAESTLNLKGDSYVASITDGDSTLSNIDSNGHNIYYDVNTALMPGLTARPYP